VRYPIIMPSLGATGGDVRFLNWLAEPGQFVKAGTPLFVVETDKASVEVEAFRSGYLAEVWADPGDEIAVGSQVAVLADSMEEINYTGSTKVRRLLRLACAPRFDRTTLYSAPIDP